MNLGDSQTFKLLQVNYIKYDPMALLALRNPSWLFRLWQVSWPRVKTALRLPPSAQAENSDPSLATEKGRKIEFPPGRKAEGGVRFLPGAKKPAII